MCLSGDVQAAQEQLKHFATRRGGPATGAIADGTPPLLHFSAPRRAGRHQNSTYQGARRSNSNVATECRHTNYNTGGCYLSR